ncbi:DedA family protein [Corynebacterium lowii]|uniref:Inner membrane protein YabI n=1 Tax=Corynebacterium lowii TaxID=1544413 RepID=A0A0Q0YK65_9CORY|nr:DedA family protein [Corynebacterium lowii]KQB87239.1 Inner membrane protein YabI [Corynebacterium lowii]MDP9852174.1 membrane protein DedA with SNARE-associated domain [Corynebacterium lowii]
MTHQIEAWVELFMTSALFYPITATLVFLDCLIPFFPSESILTMAGAWSGSTGNPNIWGIIATGIIFAVIGDNVCYLLGTRFVHFIRSAPPKSKLARTMKWVESNMRRRAGFTIIIARFIPWGRLVITLSLGSMRYPWKKFFLFDTIGVIIWATQAGFVGYLGGYVVQDYPLVGLALGLTLGALVGVLIDKINAHFSEYSAVRSATSRA